MDNLSRANDLTNETGCQRLFEHFGLRADEQDLPAAARIWFARAIKSDPNNPASWVHLGNLLRRTSKPVAASRCLHRALELYPESGIILCNLGNAYKDRGLFDKAEKFYERALALKPNWAEAHFNLAMVLLLRGQLAQGWRHYQWRLKFLPPGRGYPFRYGLPLWQGQNPQTQGILVYDEQGYGDVFLFSRYLDLLNRLGARVVFETRRELIPLFVRQPYLVEVLNREHGQPPTTACKWCVPLASLPHLFGTRVDTIPAGIPYIKPEAGKSACWKSKLNDMFAIDEGSPGIFKIGLVWNTTSRVDKFRSLGLENFARLARLCSRLPVVFFGIQKVLTAAEKNHRWLIMLDKQMTDFHQTAAIIDNLDLVITIDTAVAHLAGAMGKPVWVLLPKYNDWRWFLERQDSPWYPSMRLFRQRIQGNWQPVIDKVAETLAKLLNNHVPGLLIKPARSDHGLSNEAYHLGRLFLQQGRLPDAVRAFRLALESAPENHLAWNDLGIAFHRLGNLNQAMAAFGKALEAKPGFVKACQNMGNVYLDLNDPDKVIECYEMALNMKKPSADDHLRQAKLCLQWLRLDKAEKHLNCALADEPQHALAHTTLASVHMLKADFLPGWHHFRWRRKLPDYHTRIYPHRLESPKWEGQDLRGKTILVHCEQGLGDTIQFVRYLPILQKQGATIVAEVHPPLVSLVAAMPAVSKVVALSSDSPCQLDVDFHVSLLDLPGIFGTTIDSIPGSVPYLKVARGKILKWQPRIVSQGLKVGMVWKGSPFHSKDNTRSLELGRLEPLLQFEGIDFFSLQKPAPEASTVFGTQRNLGSALKDFSDTAAVIALLDLVITVDTAVAHLAGALGKPVWVMLPHLPDWRWMLDRHDSPWYPGMRLFRQQQPNHWGPVIQRIRQRLAIWQAKNREAA